MKRKKFKLKRKQIQPIKKQKPAPSEPKEIKAFRDVCDATVKLGKENPNKLIRAMWQNPHIISLAKKIAFEHINNFN